MTSPERTGAFYLCKACVHKNDAFHQREATPRHNRDALIWPALTCSILLICHCGFVCVVPSGVFVWTSLLRWKQEAQSHSRLHRFSEFSPRLIFQVISESAQWLWILEMVTSIKGKRRDHITRISFHWGGGVFSQGSGFTENLIKCEEVQYHQCDKSRQEVV